MHLFSTTCSLNKHARFKISNFPGEGSGIDLCTGNDITCTNIHAFKNVEKIQFRSNLLNWYNENKRDLPWRKLVCTLKLGQKNIYVCTL